MSSWPSSAVTPTICPGWTFAPTATANSAICARSASFIRAAYASRNRLRSQIPGDRSDQPRGRESRGSLARRPFAAGQVEVAVEVPRLLHDARRPEHEAVRLEQRAKVDVGQQTGVRGVAGALEPVELERRQGIRRRDLVDDQYPAAEPGDAGELRNGQLGPGHVVEDSMTGREVEGAAVERHPRRVALDERHVL